MFILDSLLTGGLRFVLEKIALVADRELHDPARWHEALLEAQLQLESGEIDEAEFAARERGILERLRELQPQASGFAAGAADIAGVEVTTGFEEAEDARPARRARKRGRS
jgi:hypothetical protein